MENKIKQLKEIGFVRESFENPITGVVTINVRPSDKLIESLGYDSSEDCIEFSHDVNDTIFAIGCGYEGCSLLITNNKQAELIQKALKIVFGD